MGLRNLGLVLTVVGVVGSIVAAMADPDSRSLFFTLEAGGAVVAGVACLAIAGLRHGSHVRPLGTASGDLHMAQAIDAEPAVAAGDAASR